MVLILEVNGLLRCDTREDLTLNSLTMVVKAWVIVG